jgi:hypothetical protein
MQELIDKYKSWHKNTDHSWKVAVIEKCRKEGIMHINTSQDIDWLYDDCIDYLFYKTTRKITNLAKKLGYDEPPCEHCKNIIKFWNCNEDWRWSPDKAYLFNCG